MSNGVSETERVAQQTNESSSSEAETFNATIQNILINSLVTDLLTDDDPLDDVLET